MATRYVDPGAQAGGDGTTPNLTGSTCAWQGLEEAVTALNALGTLLESYTVYCATAGATNEDAAAAQVTLSVVTNGYTVTIIGEGAETPIDTTKYYFTNTSSPSFKVTSSNVTVQDMQFLVTYAVTMESPQSGGLFERCVSKSSLRWGFWMYDGTVRNCTAYECGRDGFIHSGTARTGTFHNCTAVSCGTEVGTYYGFVSSWGTMTCVNCLGWNNVDGDFGQDGNQTATNVSYCASDDSTADNFTGSNNIVDISDPFVSVAGDDYHITSAGVTALVGQDLSGTFTTDIDGDTRANWAIGADDGPAASSMVTIFCRGRLRW